MIFILCLFYLAINQEIQNESIYLSLGESVQGFVSPKTQNYHVYQFVVPEIQNNTELVIQLKTLNPNSDPNLYISKNVTKALSIKDADIQACEAKGMDICILDNDKIKENDILFITVVSRFPSRYVIRIELDQEKILMIDNFLAFKMTSEKQSQILVFKIPEFIQEQTEIEINIQVLNQEQLEEPFQVFMNKEENGTPSNDKYDYKAIDTWDNQKVIEFNQQGPLEQYQILIQGQQGSVFRVTATRSQNVKIIHLYENIIQVVKQGDFDYYKANVDNSFDCDLAIRLIPFKGYAKLFVHYNVQPPLLERYEWQEENQEVDLIYITRKELQNKNISLYALFIAVLGEELCTYQLLCTCEQEGYIFSNTRYQRIINQQEIMRLDLIDYQYENHQIQVNFNVINGVINFLITNCFDQSICPKEELFVNKDKYANMTEYIMIYSNYQQENQIVLNCNSACNYLIYAIVDSKINSDGKFEIMYKNYEQSTYLIQNTPHKAKIEKNQYQYYHFFVSEDDQLQRLHFLVSLIQGEVTIYLSTQYQKPNESYYEYKSQNNSINFGGRYSNQPQSGNYYISIYGNSVSKYMITVWIIKNYEDSKQLGKYPWHYIQLYQGDIHDHFLFKDEFVLYKIDLNGYQQTFQYPFNVILYKSQGQFRMFGFDHPETDESKALWQSGQIISIFMNDPKYPQILYLKIKLDQTAGIYGNFKIAFYFYNQEIKLLLDEPFFNFIPAQNSQLFHYEFSQNESFIISKKSFEYDQSALLFQDQNFYGLQIRQSENTNIIQVINKQEIFCQIQPCTFQFFISLYSKLDQYYSILISRMENSEIQLTEDYPITKIIPLGDDYYYLYCYGEEINIQAFNYYGDIKIYALIVQDLNSPYPSASQYDKMSIKLKVSTQASIYFSQTELKNKNCNENCIIKLTVIISKDSISDINYQLYDYTIQYNSKLILLRESEIQEGQLTQSGLKFYKIHVSKNDTNLMILLKPNPNQEADLLVSKSKFPNLEKFDWGSFDIESDVLILEPGNIVHSDLSGDYYVAVFCYTTCYFTIQYNLGNVETYDIFSNQPYKFYVGANYTVFLRLYSYKPTTTQMIFVQSLSETVYFYVDEIDYQTSKLSYTKDLTTFKYNNDKRGYKKQLITEPLQIDNILLIALKTYNSEIVTVQVSNQEDEIYLDSQTQFQYYLEKNNKIIFTINPIDDYVMLKIYVYSGQITCSYSLVQQNYNENFQTLILLEIKSDNHENTFRIKNDKSQLNIFVEAIFNSHFSIYYSNEIEEVINIDSIYPVFVQLKSHTEKQLICKNYDFSKFLNTSKTFQISVQIQENQDIVLTHQKQRYLPIIQVSCHQDEHLKTTEKVQLVPIKQVILSNLIYNEYIQCGAHYFISLYNQAQFDQNYQIQIGNSDMKLLIPRLKQLGRNQLYKSSYWALQRNDLYTFYEMQFCNGIFSVHIGRDYEGLKNGQYDQKIDIKQNKQVFGFIDKIDLGNFIYLKFDLIKSFDIIEALFTIRIYQVEEKTDIPFNKFYPGLQGVLTSYITEDLEQNITIHIEFAPLELNQNDNQTTFLVEYIEYFVILKERYNDNQTNFDYCTEPQNETRIVKNQIDNDTQLYMNVTLPNFRKQQQRNFVFTILATVNIQLFRDDQKVQLDYYYETSQTKWNSQQTMILNNGNQFIYQWLGYTIVIIMLIVLIIVFVRMKRNQIISKYDNSNIQNSNVQGIEMNYRGLNE